MRRFLSWDCGNKTLAHAHVTINTSILQYTVQYENRLQEWLVRYPHNPIEEWIRGDCADTIAMTELFAILRDISAKMKTFITFHSVGVNDILEGRKVADTDEVERTVALSKFLEGSSVDLNSLLREDNIYRLPTEILIEHQPSKVGMATNNKSTMIGHQLMFYYVGRKVALISPKLKNQISMPGIVYSQTYGGASTPYYARKKHCKDMFLLLLKVLDCEYVKSGVAASCMDDLADATMQIFAYCKDKKLFVR